MEALMYGKKYFIDKPTDLSTFRIEPSAEPVNNTLFKYCRLSEFSVDIVKNNRFFATQPDMFNDIFDFHYSLIDYSKVTLEQFLLNAETLEERDEIITQFNKDPEILHKKYSNTVYSILLSKFGILSVTTEDTNDLMWGYYGNNMGFQIELDYSKFPSSYLGPYPVNYVPKLVPADVSNLGGHFAVMIQATAKKDIWKHENEYRFLIEAPKGFSFKVSGNFSNEHTELSYVDRLIDFPPNVIKSVTLGFNFFTDISQINIAGKEYEYLIKFEGNDANLKIELLETCLNRKIPIFLINQDIDTFRLSKSKLEIIQLFKDTFHIREIKAPAV